MLIKSNIYVSEAKQQKFLLRYLKANMIACSENFGSFKYQISKSLKRKKLFKTTFTWKIFVAKHSYCSACGNIKMNFLHSVQKDCVFLF